jgi:hypothetical protein
MIIYGYEFVVDLLIKYYKDVVNNILFYSSMSLQPFVGPWLLLQFHNMFYTDGRTPWTSDQPVERIIKIITTSNSIFVFTRCYVIAQQPSKVKVKLSLCLTN